MGLAFSVISISTKTYDMAISSILRYYNAKAVYLISLLYDLNVVKISSKQLRNYRTSIHCHKRLKSNWFLKSSVVWRKYSPHFPLCPSFCLRRTGLTGEGIINFYILILYFSVYFMKNAYFALYIAGFSNL